MENKEPNMLVKHILAQKPPELQGKGMYKYAA